MLPTAHTSAAEMLVTLVSWLGTERTGPRAWLLRRLGKSTKDRPDNGVRQQVSAVNCGGPRVIQ